jgi:hypothetical protein
MNVDGFVAPSDIVTGVAGAEFNYAGSAAVVAQYLLTQSAIGNDIPTITINDTAANISQYLDTLNSFSGKISGAIVTDGQPVPVSVAQLTSDAAMLSKTYAFSFGSYLAPLAVVDTAANLSGATLDTLQANVSNISSIVISDNGASNGGLISASVAEYLADPDAIAKIDLANGQLPAKFIEIRDTAANIQANLSSLNFFFAPNEFIYGAQIVGPITITDDQPVTVPASQYSAYSTQLRNADGTPVNLIAAPSIFISGSSIGLQSGVVRAASFQGSGVPNATIHFSIDGTPVATTATANATGSFSFTPTGLATGVHQIVASETNAQGGTGTSSALSFALDPNAPTLQFSNNQLSTILVGNATQTFTGTIDPAVAGQPISLFAFRQTLIGSGSTDANGHWSGTATLNGYGFYNVVATVKDAAGNQIATTTEESLVYYTRRSAPASSSRSSPTNPASVSS